MRARRVRHADVGHRGRISARWRCATVVVAAAALSLAAGAVPAWAAGGYAVTATIPVGSNPEGVAVDPAAGTVYVTNQSDGTVSVVDEATSTVTATIPLGSGQLWAYYPEGVAVDPAAGTVYVANAGYGFSDGGNLSVIDAATSTVTATILPFYNPPSAPADPWGVAVDPTANTVYVTNYRQYGTVAVIDEATSGVTATIPVGSYPEGVAADPAAGTVYVANFDSGTVSVIDEATSTVTATIPVGSGPEGVAADPAAGTVYVTSADGTVSVIDAATSAVTATISVGSGPRGVAVDPAAGTVYVANSGDDTVSVIDAATSAVTATIPVGSDPSGVAVDPATHTAYVANSADDTVSVITPPAPPSGLAAAVVGPVSGPPSGVALTWTDNATDPAATLVRVERASDPGFTVGVTDFPLGAAATSYTDTAVVEGATYYYRVQAENDGTTSAWSDPVSITFTTVPAAPASLAVTGPVSGALGGVTLNWTDTPGGALVTHMVVQRATNPGFTTGLADFPLGTAATSYTDSNVVQGTTYYYRVRAENEASNSDWSNTVSVLYTTVPAAPAGLTATLAGSSVSLNWTVQADIAPATQLDIERATNSGFTSKVTDTLVGPALSTYTDSNVVKGTTYYYRVRAENQASDSAWSNVASILVPLPPAAPGNLFARAVVSGPASDAISLTWTENTAPAVTGFTIQDSTSPAFTTAVTTFTAGPAIRTYALAGLLRRTRYYIRIEAVTGAATSGWTTTTVTTP
jgi:YVTN family beta-propeller protein